MTSPYRTGPNPPEKVKAFDPFRPLRYLVYGFLMFSWGITTSAVEEMGKDGEVILPIFFGWCILFGILCIPAIWIGWWTLWLAIGQFPLYAWTSVSFRLRDKEIRENWHFWATK